MAGPSRHARFASPHASIPPPFAILFLLFFDTGSILVPSALGLQICPRARLAFFHIPKAGGTAVQHLLERQSPHDCKKGLAWGMVNFHYKHNNVKFDAFDAAHVTPKELEYYVHHRAGAGALKDWNFTDPDDGRPLSQADVLNEFETFAVVRNPYLRVLGAMDQRNMTMNRKRWGPFPDDFATAMHYIDDGIKNRTLHWMASPTITHFRPASLYTHWENNLPALRHVFKLEDLQPALNEFLKKQFNPTKDFEVKMVNTKDESKTRKSLCDRPSGCVGKDDLDALLSQTAHTLQTIRIVNRLYWRDFELLGYNMLIPSDDGVDGDDMEIKRPPRQRPTFLTTTDLWRAVDVDDNPNTSTTDTKRAVDDKGGIKDDSNPGVVIETAQLQPIGLASTSISGAAMVGALLLCFSWKRRLFRSRGSMKKPL